MPSQTFTITALVIPAAPTALIAVPLPTSTDILLNWTDSSANETNFKVLRRTGSSPFAVLAAASALGPGVTSFLDTLTSFGATYDYQVVAYNGSGDSPVSNTASATAGSQLPEPEASVPIVEAPYVWIDAAGGTHELSAPGDMAVLVGARGLLMPSFSLTETESPFTEGSVISGMRALARDVDLPLLVEAEDTIGLRQQMRALVQRFSPLRGDGILRVSAPDGTTRDLYCRYVGGLDAATDDIAQAGPNWWLVALTLHAADPYFYASEPVMASFSTAAPVPFFPFFPLQLSASSVVSSAAAQNEGDVEAWPVWTITGPATVVTLTNVTTGQSLTLTTPLGAGDTITIDTRKGRKSVTKRVGGVDSNALGTVLPTSSLWPLAVGFNDLDIVMSGSSDVSSVALTYVPRFMSI